MKICLIQLPLVDPHYSSLEANVPLAGAYLKSYWESLDSLKTVKIEYLPRELCNTGGDASILRYLEEGSFFVFGFTVFMWNLERSLYFAEKLKKINPEAFIFFGGPEISQGSPAFTSPFVDAFVSGEGEHQFAMLIKKIISGPPIPRLSQESCPLDLSGIPNPYLSNALDPGPGSILHLETMRGCSFSCAYCYYPKSFHEIRFFPEERIPAFFEYARKNHAKEIYIMDPSFNSSARFTEQLHLIKDNNPTGIPLHTEIRLETINSSSAALMHDAGFVSVEAGLQTTNPLALKQISRNFNAEKFIQGAELLQKQNIEIRTGVILGLPGDGLNEFSKTLDFLSAHKLDEYAEIYPLSLLPGSALLSRAKKCSISHQSSPPYFVLETPEMNPSDFSKAVSLIRNTLGKELFTPVFPCFDNRQNNLIRFLNLKIPSHLEILLNSPHQMANTLTLLLNMEMCHNFSLLKEIASILRENNPFSLIQFVIEENDPLPEPLFKDLQSIFYHEQYFDRINVFNDNRQQCYSTHFFQLSEEWKTIDYIEKNRLPFEPIFHYSSKKRELDRFKPLLELFLPIILTDPEKLSSREIRILKKIYADFPEYYLSGVI